MRDYLLSMAPSQMDARNAFIRKVQDSLPLDVREQQQLHIRAEERGTIQSKQKRLQSVIDEMKRVKILLEKRCKS